MNELQQETEKTLKVLETYEKRWHVFKAILYVLVGVAIIVTNIYTYHHIIVSNDHNRNLLKCALISFTPTTPNESVTKFNSDIRNYIKEN